MQQLVSMEGKCVVVTGAAQGIGKALTELVIEQGGTVVAVDRNADQLKATAAALPADRVLPLVGSVTDEDFAAEAVRQGVARFGAIQGLVNNAGIIRPAMIEKMNLTQWREVIDVHLTGSFIWLHRPSPPRHSRRPTPAPAADSRTPSADWRIARRVRGG